MRLLTWGHDLFTILLWPKRRNLTDLSQDRRRRESATFGALEVSQWWRLTGKILGKIKQRDPGEEVGLGRHYNEGAEGRTLGSMSPPPLRPVQHRGLPKDYGLNGPDCHSNVFGSPGHFSQLVLKLARIGVPSAGAENSPLAQGLSKCFLCGYWQNSSWYCVPLW